ncbi:hypothetical protein [Photobacterium satsumensis]|uniref:hypothetical protein n=1 Tax=Photobacterium satsumensis TaxID=2910239 RepID=UPI003D0A9BC4
MKLNLTVPPIAEQERIARELDELKGQIDKATCLNEKEALSLKLRDKMAFYFGQKVWSEHNEESEIDEK